MKICRGTPACMIVFALLCLLLAACGQRALTPVPEGSAGAARQPAHATACEEPALPLALRVPQTDGAVNTLWENGVLSGVFTTVSSCRTRDFCTGGSITVVVQAALNDDAPPADGKLALWQLTENGARYLQTVSFSCDGSAQGWTFDGLDAAGQYRLVFSYTESASRRMSGAFTVDGVTEEIIEDLPEENAVAVDAPPAEPQPVEDGAENGASSGAENDGE